MSSVKRLMLFVVLVVGVCGAPAFAQKWEVYPYAGGAFTTDYKIFDFKNPGVFGLKGGLFVSDNVSIEANGGYVNQFNFRGFSYRTHALTYDISGLYNFANVNIRGVRPFVTFGIGGTTLSIDSRVNTGDHDSAVYPIPIPPEEQVITPNRGPIPQTLIPFTLSSGDAFFQFNYGGGIKAQRLFGPMGFRADFKGNTMPNFFGSSVSQFVMTGGLLFSFGER